MATDIFEFWSHIGPAETVHPADRDVFQRLGLDGHSFNHKTLPACFNGPLKTASVVLLYMSPGYRLQDEIHAQSTDGQNYYMRRRKGEEPLQDAETPGGKWWRERTKCFDVDETVIASHLSILNIGAYHSKEMKDPELLAALPSSRVCLDWAQGVLFPEALSGKRVVVCMRAAKFWGLRTGQFYEGTLFAPKVNRGGYMEHGDQREFIIQVVQDALSSN